MRDLLMKQSIYERDILTQQSMRILRMRDIVTLQSMKENPYSARDTKVKIDKRESLECARY